MLRKALIIMLVMEAVSLTSFLYHSLSLPLLILVFVATLVISFKRLEWGVYILFAELFFGSRGHLLEYGFLSLRLAIFAAVFAAWLIGLIRGIGGIGETRGVKDLPKIYWALLTVIALGAIHGYLRGYGISNVFFDVNGYLYLAILPAVLSVVKTREQVGNLFQILAAAIIVIALKTLTLFIWFTYGIAGVATLYHWVIDQDIGEITGVVGSASRIFMQSQFWATVGLFIFLFLPPLHLPLFASKQGEKEKTNFSPFAREGESKRGLGQWLIISSAVFSVIMSLSRSFWLGGLAGAVFAAAALLFYFRAGLGKSAKLGGTVILIAVLEIGGIYLLSLPSRGIAESVASRGINPTGEAAGGARLLLLPNLLAEIKQNPIIGKGFGKAVSYDSYLPDRVSKENPSGMITSYAFEWGYLDTALKIGALGLVIYLLFIARIFANGWKAVQVQSSKFKVQNFGILSGLVALVVLNITTPYLNHPLGIGYLILAIVSFEVFNFESL